MKNLADILRNTPKDLRLYSPVTGPVRFKKVYIDNTIEVHSELDNSIYIFEEYGRWLSGRGECLLLPSQFERTWDDWQSELLVDGDYVYDTESEETFIFVDNDEDCALIDCFGAKHFIDDDYFSCLRFASIEEIDVFKTKRDESKTEFVKQSSKCDNCAGKNNAVICADLDCQKYETITQNTFKDYDFTPFEKVLVRDNFDEVWNIEFYGGHNLATGEYFCLAHTWFYCIPYNERTKHLLGTTSNQIRKA